MSPKPEEAISTSSKSTVPAVPTIPSVNEEKKPNNRLESKYTFISFEDYKELSKIYDKDGNGRLDDSEIDVIVSDYNNGRLDKDSRVYQIISRYDLDRNGKIDLEEIEKLRHSFHVSDSEFRYGGYAAALSRAFRYLAFTSDFGEALRPVVHKNIVTASYAVAFGYCIADVGYEAYKLKKNNYRNEKLEEITMTQCIVERSTFQALASLILPAVVIHQTVHVSKSIFTKLGRFTKWGPSIVGLSVIPFLPVCLDEPIEKLVEAGFHKYGPWAKKDHSQEDHSHKESKKEK